MDSSLLQLHKEMDSPGEGQEGKSCHLYHGERELEVHKGRTLVKKLQRMALVHRNVSLEEVRVASQPVEEAYSHGRFASGTAICCSL